MNEITIGIPTYNRPKLLEQLLKEIFKQTYRNFFIYVSVNKSEDSKNREYLKISKKKKYKNIIFFFQKKKIPSGENFNFLKNKCKTKYFMWLADDDRLSYSTIEILYNSMKKNKGMKTIMPNWLHITSNNSKIIKKPIDYNSRIFFFRLIKFLFIGNDSFIYGLHKVNNVKKHYFEKKKYFFPNKNVSWNLGYLPAITLLSEGKISVVKSKKAIWINDDFSQIKYHSKSNKEKFFMKNFKLLILKINFYYFVLIRIKNLKKYFELFFLIFFLPFIIVYKFYYYLNFLFSTYLKKMLNRVKW